MTTATLEQAKLGVRKYVENEIAYKAGGFTKFMVFFILPSIDKEIASLVNKAKESPLMAEFFTDEGNILLDDVYTRALMAVDRSGKIVLEKYGLSLDKTDIEKLYQYIRGV